MKPTFITGYANDGELVMQYTIRKDVDGVMHKLTNAVRKFLGLKPSAAFAPRMVMVSNPDGVVGGDPWSYTWTTLASGRRTLEALIQKDGRRSGRAPNLFINDTTVFTNTRGELRGRWESFDSFVAHMLASSGDGEYKGEGLDDRIIDATIVLTQQTWPEFIEAR